MDLVIFEVQEAFYGFQLAFPHWNRVRGFAHYLVDDGELFAEVSDAPFLYVHGPFKRDRVFQQFLAMASEITLGICSFIEGKFRDCGGLVVP